MKKSYLNILKIVIAFFIVSFILVQLYNSLYNPFTTESATYYSTYDGVSITGTSVRTENVLSSAANGVKSFVAADGKRVAKDSIIAKIYSNSADAQNAGRIAEIDAQIAQLNSLNDYNNSSAADLISLEKQISDGYVSLLQSADEESMIKVNELSADLLTLINKKQIAVGQSGDFSSLISSLEAEKTSLNASGIRSTGSVTAENSGYFVTEVDGYEKVLTADGALKLTPENLTGLSADETLKTNSAGKIVGDYEWYIASVMTAEDAAKFSEDSSLTLKTDLVSMPELPVTVAKINKSADGASAAVIYKCKYINSELASIRTQRFTAVLKSYSGLRISTKAVRVVDGQKGVYVVSGSTAKFKTVEIVYSAGGYSICKMSDSSSSTGLALYDEVIVKGKNLYDGKIIK